TARSEQLGDEGGHPALGDVVGVVGGLQLGLGEDVVQQGHLGRLRAGSAGLGRGVGHEFPGSYLVSLFPMPSSAISLARVVSSPSRLCSFLRKAGTFPSGLFSAVSAERSSRSFLSSGTCLTIASGPKSFRFLNLRSTLRLASFSPESLSGTDAVKPRFCFSRTSLKLSLSTLTVLRSSSDFSSSGTLGLYSPITRMLSGSSTSSCAPPSSVL